MGESRAVPVEVPDGSGIIEVAGDNDASMLLFAGDAVVAAGGDGAGAEGMLTARAGPAAPAASEVKSLADRLADPGPLGEAREWQGSLGEGREWLGPLLGLLRPGRYLVTALAPLRPVVPEVRAGVTTRRHDPEEIVLVLTDHARDERTVRRYRDAITEEGAVPAVVVLSPVPHADVAYVLDGHHRLEACRREDRPPALLRIAPERPFRPRRDDVRKAAAAFPEAGPLLADLRGQSRGWAEFERR
jgi:hypothetical protein